VASVQLSASSTAGTAVLLLYRVLADINITIQNVKVTVDRKNQIPSMVRIPDGACLGWLLGAGAAVASNSTFAGHEEFIWG
jgi:hypothetical protein